MGKEAKYGTATTEYSKTINCCACGAPLEIKMNEAYIKCKYCGADNVVSSEHMRVNVNQSGINISSKTNIDNLLKAVDTEIRMGSLGQAEKMIVQAVASGCSDYRIHIYTMRIGICRHNFKTVFSSMEQLAKLIYIAKSDGKIAPEEYKMKTDIEQAVKETDNKGMDILTWSILARNTSAVQFCLDNKANPNQVVNGKTMYELCSYYLDTSGNIQQAQTEDDTAKKMRSMLVRYGAHRPKDSGNTKFVGIAILALIAIIVLVVILNKFGLTTNAVSTEIKNSDLMNNLTETSEFERNVSQPMQIFR